jgi:hypothetical protein
VSKFTKHHSAITKDGGAKTGKVAERADEPSRSRRTDVGGPVGSSHNHGVSRKPGDASGLHEMGRTVPSFEEARHARLGNGGGVVRDANASVNGGLEPIGEAGHGKDD